MRRSLNLTARKSPVSAAVLLALTLGAFLVPGCGPPPVDDLLSDTEECGRDEHCQSGHCWQDSGEDTKTCKATPPPPPAADG